jgi:enoyl-CoA hydratase
MTAKMRQSTLETLGLGTVLEIFQNGKLPVNTGEWVDRVFGANGNRGALVVSGANGIVGAGKTMQLGSRLRPFDIPIIALDFPGAADGIGQQFQNLDRAFGKEGANRIMENVIRIHYDGAQLPGQLKKYQPKFLLEAIPEILELKKSHYELFRANFPGIQIRSVTSGFPASQLGVGIAHPAFPHEINKVYETVEPEPSDVTQLLWALGLIPVPVSDDWSFVLDVLFCGLTLTGIRYHEVSNMPYWKIDKYIRRLLGPNPFRAHDAIGAKGANFLTWSCLHHLGQHYGDLFTPTTSLEEHKEIGENWYPPNHFRPLVNWSLDSQELREFATWILGPYFQMVALLLKENRSHFSQLNMIGEMCAQFRNGPLAQMRKLGADAVTGIVEDYHKRHPRAAESAWYPEVFSQMGNPEWQQLYVNAEHDGSTGVITIGRESYNRDVNLEMNRAIDWLKAEKIDRVIVTGDFHLSTQLVGADTADFYPALNDEEAGYNIAKSWSQTARRLHYEFAVSVGFINGKRCLGGMLELMSHCHFVVAVTDSVLGMPEVTLPVVPGMEGCHWPLRKARPGDFHKILHMLLEGQFVKASEAVGWFVDYAGSLEDALQKAWLLATGGDHGLTLRKLEEGELSGLPGEVSGLTAGGPALEAARKAIFTNARESCAVKIDKALEIQSRQSAQFMCGKYCQKGAIGTEYTKTMKI